jgi:hypothetical protein
MTADEIRKHWNVTGNFPPELIGDFALIEIAAQLAELNARLQRLTGGNGGLLDVRVQKYELSTPKRVDHGRAGLRCQHCGCAYPGTMIGTTLHGPCPKCGEKTAQRLIDYSLYEHTDVAWRGAVDGQ